jgi:hypothetical protein
MPTAVVVIGFETLEARIVGRIAKIVWMVSRIDSARTARDHEPAAIVSAVDTIRSRAGSAENAHGSGDGSGDGKRDESLSSTHGGLLSDSRCNFHGGA